MSKIGRHRLTFKVWNTLTPFVFCDGVNILKTFYLWFRSFFSTILNILSLKKSSLGNDVMVAGINIATMAIKLIKYFISFFIKILVYRFLITVICLLPTSLIYKISRVYNLEFK